MRYFLLFLALISCVNLTIGQTTQFMTRIGSSGPDNSGCYDDHGDIIYASDSGFIVTGTIGETTSERDILLARLNQNGDTLWTRILGQAGSYQFGRALSSFNKNDFILLSENNNSYCSSSSYIIRFNEMGDTVWCKAFFYPANAKGIDVIQSSDGNILALFQYMPFSPFPSWDYGLMLVKLDSNGNIMWDKGYSYTGEYITPANIVENTDGSILMSGQIGMGPVDLFLLKTDAQGNVLWANSLIIPSSNEEGYNIYSYPDGTTLALGRFTDTDGSYKTLLYKVNTMGKLLWMKKIKLLRDTRSSAMCGIGYRVFVGGSSTNSFSNQTMMMEVDSSGNRVWAKSYPNAAGGLNECICNNTEIIGSGFITQSGSYADHLIIKTLDDGSSCNGIALYDTTTNITPVVQSLTTIIESNSAIIQYCPIDIRSGMLLNQFCTTTDLEEWKEDDFLIFPNPTTGNIFIDLGSIKQELKATLINSLGQILLVKNYKSIVYFKLNLDYPKGIYFLTLESEGEVITKKILKN